MKKQSLKTVITFYTTADAMETEAVFNEAGISGRLIPVPRQLSAGCGIAWVMTPEDYSAIPPEILKKLPEAEQIKQIML